MPNLYTGFTQDRSSLRMSRWFACAGVVLTVIAGLNTPAYSESSSGSTTGAQKPGSSSAEITQKPTSADSNATQDFAELKKFLDDQSTRLKQLDEEVNRGLKGEEDADHFFDQLVESYRDTAKEVGSASNYNANLGKLAEDFDKKAKQYAAEQDPALHYYFAYQFKKLAQQARDYQSQGVAESDKALNQIRELGTIRKVVSAEIALHEGQKALDAAKEQLEIVHAVNERIRKYIDDFTKLHNLKPES